MLLIQLVYIIRKDITPKGDGNRCINGRCAVIERKIRKDITPKGDGNFVLVFLNNKWLYNIYLDNSIFQLKLAYVYQKFELISIFICTSWCIFFCTMIWLKFSYGKIEYTYKLKRN